MRSAWPGHPAQTFAFVGVTASASSINQVFPRWAEVLGLGSVRFQPLDLDLDTQPETYRRVVAAMRDDPGHRGALVTSHKVRLLRAARDLFDDVDSYASLCDEVSCISKRGDRLVGHAKDPITSGRSLEDFLPADYFARTQADVVCLGAGGSGLAIAVYLLTRRAYGDRPARLTLVNRGSHRLEECRAVLERLAPSGCELALIANEDPRRNDELVADAGPGSLIVNATGMGKDRPGSPLSDAVAFPENAVVWELNYRGTLRFLEQARAQERARSLRVEDGWRYFIHGWSEVIAEAFEVELTPETLARLDQEAAGVRS